MLAITIKDLKVVFSEKTILTPAEKMQTTTRKGFGAYCRTIMRNSIKQASGPKQHSAPGQPPFHHGGPTNFKDTVFFIDDPHAKKVVIGAVLLPGRVALSPTPGVLEHGGNVLSGKRVSYLAARPHAQPAFDKAVTKMLPKLIAGGIMREV